MHPFPPSRIAHHTLEIADPDTSLAFYQDKLGMALVADLSRGDARHYFLGFIDPNTQTTALTSSDTLLELVHRPGPSRRSPPPANVRDGYWKITLSVPDVDHARRALMDKGVHVSQPVQFLDIAYLCHLEDPDGYCIELLQHTFAQNHIPSPPQPAYALQTPPQFNLITLRVKDPEASLRFYGELLGMRLMSRQVVAPRRFTLYFLAYTDEQTPVADLDAVENREWLWQRPYTMLEFQHAWGTEEGAFAYRVGPATGFGGMGIAVEALDSAVEALSEQGVGEVVCRVDDLLQTRIATVYDPDGFPVRLIEAT